MYALPAQPQYASAAAAALPATAVPYTTLPATATLPATTTFAPNAVASAYHHPTQYFAPPTQFEATRFQTPYFPQQQYHPAAAAAVWQQHHAAATAAATAAAVNAPPRLAAMSPGAPLVAGAYYPTVDAQGFGAEYLARARYQPAAAAAVPAPLPAPAAVWAQQQPHYATTVGAGNFAQQQRLLPIPDPRSTFYSTTVGAQRGDAGSVGYLGSNGSFAAHGGYTAPSPYTAQSRATVAPAYGTPIVGKIGRERFARSQAFRTLSALGLHDAARNVQGGW